MIKLLFSLPRRRLKWNVKVMFMKFWISLGMSLFNGKNNCRLSEFHSFNSKSWHFLLQGVHFLYQLDKNDTGLIISFPFFLLKSLQDVWHRRRAVHLSDTRRRNDLSESPFCNAGHSRATWKINDGDGTEGKGKVLSLTSLYLVLNRGSMEWWQL